MTNQLFQAALEDELIIMQPLHEQDFEKLYEAASDPLIWEQHPNPDRYQKEVFRNFFKGAMESKGAYIVYNKLTNEVVGSSRFYDYNEASKSVLIGYTFIQRKFWGKGYNPVMKALMMNHAYQLVDKIYFHVGAINVRSQIAMGRIGGQEVREIEVAYYGEPTKINKEYVISKENFYANK
jgi:N-acetyltransferase